MMQCYNCYEEVNWLAPDSRCGKCTHMTPEEIQGIEECDSVEDD